MYSNPRYRLNIFTVFLRVFDIIFGVMFFHLPDRFIIQYRVVEGGAILSYRWSLFLIMASLGHRSGYPEALCPIFLFLKPFFLGVYSTVANIEDCRLASVAVTANTRQPQLNVIFLSQKGVPWDLELVY